MFALTLMYSVNICVNYWNKHAKVHVSVRLAAEPLMMFVCLLKHTPCHCQTHVLMAADLQIFSCLQGAIEVSL